MIYIAHRALYEGPNVDLENHPDQIRKALSLGFDCEIDVRYIKGKWLLGHDKPTYEVNPEFLLQSGLWIHCKNINALANIEEIDYPFFHHPPNYFWHQTDDYVLTSMNYIWTYPGRPVNAKRGIIVQPEWEDNWRDNVLKFKALGICSKYVADIRSIRLENEKT